MVRSDVESALAEARSYAADSAFSPLHALPQTVCAVPTKNHQTYHWMLCPWLLISKRIVANATSWTLHWPPAILHPWNKSLFRKEISILFQRLRCELSAKSARQRSCTAIWSQKLLKDFSDLFLWPSSRVPCIWIQSKKRKQCGKIQAVTQTTLPTRLSVCHLRPMRTSATILRGSKILIAHEHICSANQSLWGIVWNKLYQSFVFWSKLSNVMEVSPCL